MDKAIVERAVQALAALNGPRRHEADSLPHHRPDSQRSDVEGACQMPHCAGCYDIRDGRRIHPPKCGRNYDEWLKSWEAKGRVQ
jgi:hypothetical protein